MTDTTQPPAEPLAITGKGFMADGPHAGGFATIVVGGKAYSASEVVAALTRRAGGDAIPAGWQLVPIALPDEMAIAGAKGRQNSAISSFRDGWKYALAATPKPPAGGDAGGTRKVAFYDEPGADIRPGETLADRDRRIYQQGRHDALNDEPEAFK